MRADPMSKHKRFHDCRTARHMLQHGCRERIGPFQGWPTKPKKTALGAANTESGKETKQDN